MNGQIHTGNVLCKIHQPNKTILKRWACVYFTNLFKFTRLIAMVADVIVSKSIKRLLIVRVISKNIS